MMEDANQDCGSFTPCDCELPGYFCSGIPGILAAMENGRVAAGAVVERCDLCCRYESDAQAFARLVELGLATSPTTMGPSFTVHCYAVVRIKFPGVIAADAKQAAQKAAERFAWEVHGQRAEFADDLTGFLVDVDGDDQNEQSQEFDGELQPVNRPSGRHSNCEREMATRTIRAVVPRRSAQEHTVALVEARVAKDFDADEAVTRLTCGRNESPDDVTILWGRIQFALTEWFFETDEGKSAIRSSSYDFNVGDLAVWKDCLSLAAYLRRYGIESLSIETCADLTGHCWEFDDVLFDDSQINADSDESSAI